MKYWNRWHSLPKHKRVFDLAWFGVMAIGVLYLAGLFAFRPAATMQAQSVPGCNPTTGSQCVLSYGVAGATDTSNYTVLNAAGTGLRYYITDIECINSTTQGAYAAVKNGAGASSTWEVPCPAAGANGSFQHYDPPIRMTSTNTALAMASNTTLNTLRYVIRAYKAQ